MDTTTYIYGNSSYSNNTKKNSNREDQKQNQKMGFEIKPQRARRIRIDRRTILTVTLRVFAITMLLQQSPPVVEAAATIKTSAIDIVHAPSSSSSSSSSISGCNKSQLLNADRNQDGYIDKEEYVTLLTLTLSTNKCNTSSPQLSTSSMNYVWEILSCYCLHFNDDNEKYDLDNHCCDKANPQFAIPGTYYPEPLYSDKICYFIDQAYDSTTSKSTTSKSTTTKSSSSQPSSPAEECKEEKQDDNDTASESELNIDNRKHNEYNNDNRSPYTSASISLETDEKKKLIQLLLGEETKEEDERIYVSEETDAPPVSLPVDEEQEQQQPTPQPSSQHHPHHPHDNKPAPILTAREKDAEIIIQTHEQWIQQKDNNNATLILLNSSPPKTPIASVIVCTTFIILFFILFLATFLAEGTGMGAKDKHFFDQDDNKMDQAETGNITKPIKEEEEKEDDDYAYVNNILEEFMDE